MGHRNITLTSQQVHKHLSKIRNISAATGTSSQEYKHNRNISATEGTSRQEQEYVLSVLRAAEEDCFLCQNLCRC